MAVRTQCPRCKQALSVPGKLAGGYVNCPRCQGRFWLSKDSPADSSISDSVGGQSGGVQALTQSSVASPPVAVPPIAAQPARNSASTASSASISPPALAAARAPVVGPEPPRPYFPSVTLPAPASPSAPPTGAPPAGGEAAASTPAAPPKSRKVARLVSAEAAQSSLKLAADGQLPHLHLQENDKKGKGDGKAKSIPTGVVVAVWVVSVGLTVAMVLHANSADDSDVAEKKKVAQAVIEKYVSGRNAGGELQPYQQLLRSARQARARGDFRAERQYYKQVLDLLHTETRDGSTGLATGGHLEKGVTGSRKNDHDLEESILTVLGE
jgi:hypothetical protein